MGCQASKSAGEPGPRPACSSKVTPTEEPASDTIPAVVEAKAEAPALEEEPPLPQPAAAPPLQPDEPSTAPEGHNSSPCHSPRTSHAGGPPEVHEPTRQPEECAVPLSFIISSVVPDVRVLCDQQGIMERDLTMRQVVDLFVRPATEHCSTRF